jgi:hypothetical protein
MVIKFVPFENEQFSQIGIFEELAISLVAFLVPASYLTGLSTLILASNQHNKGINGGLTLLQYQKDEHLLHRCREAAFLPHP